VLVVGSGPAGLAAALAAGRSGARVILAEAIACSAAAGCAAPPRSSPAGFAAIECGTGGASRNAVLTDTTVFGRYDDNYLMAAERVRGRRACGTFAPVVWCWRPVRLERPLVFPGNDRPGIMLASAVETYVKSLRGRAGGSAPCCSPNNDDAYHTRWR